ncbi:MAG: hypothetical protein IPM35_04735 [Myxococcales bacterium]|nr:hypothetical protein [Myxococcales bacterium]
MTLRSSLVALALVLFAASGCGGDDDGSGGSTSTGGSGGATGGSGGAAGGTGGSAGSATGGSAGSATGGAAGSGTGGAAGAACNTLVNIGTEVAETAGTGTAPTPAGGPTPPDGKYVLTKLEVYPGSAATSTKHKITTELTGTTAQNVVESTGLPIRRDTWTVTLSGTSFDVTVTCPSNGLTFSSGYSSTTTEFKQFVTAGATTQVLTFTKQ